MTAMVNLSSFGCFAAAAVLTTRTCVKPPAVAASFRSTSGSTLAYVAVLPESVGFGRASGQESDTFLSPFVSVTVSLPAPPPENCTRVAVDLAFTLPSAPATRVVSIGAHDPSS
ncbi:hypothetical protein AB0D29_14420 [Streptomyces sp. NPDC048424]|uniref:hypothetical protein n=1 Tax=Streptomyces sp. NPDC048424 TaxID=3155265 RepID=UPI00343970C9